MFYEAEDCKISDPLKSARILEQIVKESSLEAASVIWYVFMPSGSINYRRFRSLVQLVLLSFGSSLKASFVSYLDGAIDCLERVNRNDAFDGLSLILVAVRILKFILLFCFLVGFLVFGSQFYSGNTCTDIYLRANIV